MGRQAGVDQGKAEIQNQQTINMSEGEEAKARKKFCNGKKCKDGVCGTKASV